MALSPIMVALRADIGEFSAKMGAARAEVEKLAQQGAMSHEKLAAAGKAAFLGIAGAAVAGSLVAVNAAMNYQESLTQLVTGAGESQKNIKMVGDGMISMAGKVGISAGDLSKGMYLIESSGQHGANGLLVLKAAAQGARVGAADMASVADGLTTALNDYALPASRAADVTSKLVATVAAGKTHMQDLSSSLATVLPAASTAGIGLNQVLGAMATMTALGTPAALAATYLRQTIAQLENPTAKARKEMENLGLSSIDVSKNLGARGLAGTFDLLTGAITKHMGSAGTVLIEHLQKAASSTSSFQKILADLPPTQQTYIAALATMVGGTKSMQAALELTGPHAKAFKDNIASISKATVDAKGNVAGFAETQKDFKTQLENASAAVNALFIQIGMKLIPVITNVIKVMTEHKTTVLVLAGAIGTFLVAAISVYITTVIKAAYESVVGFGKMLASATAWAAETLLKMYIVVAQFAIMATRFAVMVAVKVAGYVAMAAAATAAFIAENAATLGIIAGIAALVAAAVWLYKNWDSVWAGIKAAFAAGVAFVSSHLLYFAAALGPIGIAAYALYRNWNTVWSGIRAVVSAVWDAIRPIFSAIGSGISTITSGLSGVVGAAKSVGSAIGGLGIPGFAGGVENFSGGLAMVGEKGPELLRLPRGSSVIPAGRTAALMSGGGGGGNIYIQIAGNVLDGRQLADMVQTALLQKKARTGAIGLA